MAAGSAEQAGIVHFNALSIHLKSSFALDKSELKLFKNCTNTLENVSRMFVNKSSV